MKFKLVWLLILMESIDTTGASCQLNATVMTRTVEEGKNEVETRLQLLCDGERICKMPFYQECDTYSDLDIQTNCTGAGCSRLFNLCENNCSCEDRDMTATCPQVPDCQTTSDSGPESPATRTGGIFDPSTSPPADGGMNCPSNNTVFISTTVVVPTAIVSQCRCSTPVMMSMVEPTTTVTPITVTMWSSCPQNMTMATTMSPKTSVLSNSINTVTVTVSKSCDQPAMTEGSSSSASTALGVLLGIFMVLLVLVTTGWVWTCWSMKRRGGMTILTLRKTKFPNTLEDTNINNDSDTLKRLQNPVYDEMPATREEEGEGPGPTYEIIPMISNSSRRPKQNGTKLTGGETSPKVDSTYSLLGQEGTATTTNSHRRELDWEKGKSCGLKATDTGDSDGYKLLSMAEVKVAQGVRENVYNMEEKQEEDGDYADPEDDIDNDYFVLDGPTPVEEEKGERKQVEAMTAGEYEVPAALDRKRKAK